MGSGSEVAMEASQMVLLDNCFSSILIAIENGRLVFDNLRKVIIFLLTTGSMGEVRYFAFFYKILARLRLVIFSAFPCKKSDSQPFKNLLRCIKFILMRTSFVCIQQNGG